MFEDEQFENKDLNEVKDENIDAAKDTISSTEESTETVNDKPLEEVVESKPDDIKGEYSGGSEHQDYNFKDIIYAKDSGHTIDEDIDSVRKKFFKKINTANIVNGVSMGLMIAAFVATILVVFLVQDTQWVVWMTFGITVAIMIAGFVLASIFNKKNKTVSLEYLSAFQNTLDGFIFASLDVTDGKLATEAKIEDQSIIQAHYFKTINSIGSRAVAIGQRKGRDFLTAEVSVLIPPRSFDECNKKPEVLYNFDKSVHTFDDTNTFTTTTELPSNDNTLLDIDLSSEANNSNLEEKKKKDESKVNKKNNVSNITEIGLFGRYYSYDYKVESEDSFIIVLCGDKKHTVLPDFVDNYTPVFIPGLKKEYIVYAISPERISKYLDLEACKILNQLNTNYIVQSLFISVNSYGVKIGMNLSDDIMELPLKRIERLGSFDIYADASKVVFDFVDHVISCDEKE